jgi:hypothetical protein
MAIRYLTEYSTSQGDTKAKIGKKFRKHASSIDQYFREASLDTDLENMQIQLQGIVHKYY